MSESCVFCRIVAGEIPGSFQYRDDDVVAFDDISPSAPVHVLVIPTMCEPDVGTLGRKAPAVVGKMADVAQQIADEKCGGQYQWLFNTGADAGQTVFHAHGHVLGGLAQPMMPHGGQ